MSIFTDKYGDPRPLRIGLVAGGATVAALTVGVLLFGGAPRKEPPVQEPPARESVEAENSTEAAEPQEAEEEAKARSEQAAAWEAEIEAGDALAGLSNDSLTSMRDSVKSWARENGVGDEAKLKLVGASEGDGRGQAFYLQVDDSDRYLSAYLASSGSWSVTRLYEDISGVNDGADLNAWDAWEQEQAKQEAIEPSIEFNGTILLSQEAELAKLVGADVAAAVRKQFEASGIENAASAWVLADSIKTDGTKVCMRIVTPIYIGGGEDAKAHDVSYDSTDGLLEIAEGVSLNGGA